MTALFSLQRWRPGHLLAAWATYWAGLTAVMLGPALGPIMRVTGEGAKGSMSAGIGDGAFKVTIAEAGATVWSGQASLTAIALWIAVPPLLLWIALMVTRPRQNVILSAAKDPLLPVPAPDVEVRERDQAS